MSRIGKKPIALPKGVTVTSKDGRWEVKGPKGTLGREMPANLKVETKGAEVFVTLESGANVEATRPFFGTTRALIASAIKGVSDGYKALLKLEGTGYKADLKGQMLNLTLGLSHPVNYELPKGIAAKIVENSKNTQFTLEASDKELLGQTVAKLQSFRPPEPYKAKGVQVDGKKIRRKEGKAKAGGKK